MPKGQFNLDELYRASEHDVSARKVFSKEHRKSIASALKLNGEKRAASFVLNKIDLLVQTYIRMREATPSGEERAFLKKRYDDERKKLETLGDKIGEVASAFLALHEDTLRKLSHRTANHLNWKGEYPVRALIGRKIISGFWGAMNAAIPEADRRLKLPPGGDADQAALNVLVEGLARIWCAATNQPISVSQFGKGSEELPEKARSKPREFMETVLECAGLEKDRDHLYKSLKTISKYQLMPSPEVDDRDASDETRVQEIKRRLLAHSIRVTIKV